MTASLQYWLSDNYWIMGGAGLAMDMTPFYKVKEFSEADFYFGPAITFATGYEIWKKRKYTIDVQARILAGKNNIDGMNRSQMAFDIMIGFNVY